MTKLAHITTRVGYGVGDEVLGLCGKIFTVKVLWADLPKTKPICRLCVDAALAAATEADGVIEMARKRVALVERLVTQLNEELLEDLSLDRINELDLSHQAELEMKARDRDRALKAKTTCTCIWADADAREVDPGCPIHGSEFDEPELYSDAIGVEVPEAPDA